MYKIAGIAPIPFFVDRGTPVRIYEEVNALQRLGNQFTIFTYHLGKDIDNMKIKRIPNIPWYKKTSNKVNYHQIYLDAMLFSRSLFPFLKSDFDIAHAYLHEGVAIGSALRLFKRVPLVLDAEGSLTGEMNAHGFIRKNTVSYKMWHWIEKILNERANAIITSSPENVKNLIDEFGIEKEKVFFVRDGVDTEIFHTNYDVTDIRKKLGISENEKIVVYLGLLNYKQGVDCLLKAIPNIIDEVKNTHFLIMGYPNVDYYKRMAKELGVLDKITFTGKMDYFEAPKYLALGDVAVSPKILTTGEGNGKVYNYMAMGLPTVVFEHPVNRDILGDLGIYAKLEDCGSLADNIKKILLNGSLAKELSAKVREKAVKDYSWDKVAQEIMEVYRWVTK